MKTVVSLREAAQRLPEFPEWVQDLLGELSGLSYRGEIRISPGGEDRDWSVLIRGEWIVEGQSSILVRLNLNGQLVVASGLGGQYHVHYLGQEVGAAALVVELQLYLSWQRWTVRMWDGIGGVGGDLPFPHRALVPVAEVLPLVRAACRGKGDEEALTRIKQALAAVDAWNMAADPAAEGRWDEVVRPIRPSRETVSCTCPVGAATSALDCPIHTASAEVETEASRQLREIDPELVLDRHECRGYFVDEPGKELPEGYPGFEAPVFPRPDLVVAAASAGVRLKTRQSHSVRELEGCQGVYTIFRAR